METDKVLDPPDAPTGMKLRRRARKGKPSKLEEEIDEQREIRQIGLKEKRDKTRIVRLEKRKRNVLTNSTRRKDNVGKMGKYYLRAVKLNAKVIGQLQDMVEQNEEPESSNMTQEEDICADIVNAWNSLTTNPIMAYRNFTQFFEAVTFLSIEKYNRITSHLLSELLDVHAKRGRKSAITDQLPVYLFENDQVDIALGIYKDFTNLECDKRQSSRLRAIAFLSESLKQRHIQKMQMEPGMLKELTNQMFSSWLPTLISQNQTIFVGIDAYLESFAIDKDGDCLISPYGFQTATNIEELPEKMVPVCFQFEYIRLPTFEKTELCELRQWTAQIEKNSLTECIECNNRIGVFRYYHDYLTEKSKDKCWNCSPDKYRVLIMTKTVLEKMVLSRKIKTEGLDFEKLKVRLEKQRGNVDDEPPQKRKRLKGKNVENINETVSSEDTSIETIEIVSYASEPDNTAAELLSKNEQDIDEESNVLQESKFTAKHSFEKFVGFIQQDNTKESSVLAKQMIKDGRQLAEPIKRIHLGNSTEEANFQDFIEIEKEESKFKAWEFEKLNCELAEEKKIAPFVKEFCNAHLISDKVLTECEEIKLNDMKMLIEMEKYRTHSLFLDIPASANVEQSEITLSSNILCHQESKISEGNAANEEELKPEKLVLYSNTNRIEHGRMEAEIKNDEPMEVVDGSFTFIMSPKNEETMARINHKIYETDFRCVREEHFSEESSSIDHGICEEKMLPPFVLEDETELTAKTFEHKNSETFVAIDESESDEKDKNLIASVESVGTEKILGPQSKFLYCSNTNEDKNEEHMIIDTTPSETVNVVTIKSANECEIGNSLASTSCNIILVKEDLSHKTLSKCASGTVEIEDRIPDSKSESYAECTIEIRDLQQSDEKCCNSNEISGKPHGQLVVLENSVTTEEASRNIVMGNHLNALKNLPNETLSAEYELTLLDSDTDKINVNYEDSENESNNKPRKAAASNDELKPTPSKNVDVQDFMLSSQFEICKNLSSSPDSDENEADRDLENSPSQDNSDDEDPWLNLLYENAIKLDREQYESPEIEIIFDSNDEIKKTEFCQAPTPNQKKSSAAHCEEYPNKQIACQFQSSKSDDLTKHQMWEGIPGPNVGNFEFPSSSQAESLQHWTEHPMHKIAHENGSNSNKKCEEHSITVIQQFPSVPRKDVDQNHQEQIFEKAQHEFTQQPPISDHDRQSMGFQHGNQNTIRFEHQKNELETNFSWNQSQWQQHMEPGLQYMQNSAFSGSQVTRDQTRMLPSIEVFSQDQQLGGFNFQNQFYLHQEKNPQEDRMRNQPQSSDRQNIQINSHIRQHLQHYHIIQPFEQTQAHSSSFNHVVTINNS